MYTSELGGDRELTGTGGRVHGHTFEQRYGRSRHLEPPQVERHRQQRAGASEHDVPGRQVNGARSTLRDDALLARVQ